MKIDVGLKMFTENVMVSSVTYRRSHHSQETIDLVRATKKLKTSINRR